MEFLAAGENLPFVVSLTILVIIGVLEGAALIIGLGFSSVLDNLLPEMDVDLDIDGPDVGANNTLGNLFTWLRVGKVPLLVLLILFFLFFGLSGLFFQAVSEEVLGLLLPSWIISIPAFVITLFLVRWFGMWFEELMPNDETSAVSSDSFIGRMATIVLGAAETGKPAQAKVRDEHGLDHYLMIEPDVQGEVFEQGSKVLVVRKSGITFYAITTASEILTS